MKTNDVTIHYSADFRIEEIIKNLQRGDTLKIMFNDVNESEIEKYSKFLKEEYPDFLIGILAIEKEINISKLISNQEIDDNIEFFTQCAKDYDTLSSSLMNSLILKLKMDVNFEFPFLAFNSLKKGTINEWMYYKHGFHCCFTNKKTEQCIEASIVCGDQFGELDPYFFSLYILSTKKYIPIPTPIFHEYHDGVKVLERMKKLGVLKTIESNWKNRYTFVLSEKDTSQIKPYTHPIREKQKKFNLLRFLGLK